MRKRRGSCPLCRRRVATDDRNDDGPRGATPPRPLRLADLLAVAEHEVDALSRSSSDDDAHEWWWDDDSPSSAHTHDVLDEDTPWRLDGRTVHWLYAARPSEESGGGGSTPRFMLAAAVFSASTDRAGWTRRRHLRAMRQLQA